MDFLAKIMLVFLLAASAVAQQFISAKAGMINHAEGIFYLDQEPLQFPASRFRGIEKGKSLRTGQGWVEVLIGPNVFLWMDEEGVLRMEDPSLTNVHLLIERGSVLVDVYDELDVNKITIHFGEAIVELSHPGLYQLDSGKSLLRVYNGKAKIQLVGNKATVKRGKAVTFADGLKAIKFDTQQKDQLYEKAARRSRLLYKEILDARRRELIQRGKIIQALERQLRQQADEMQRRLELEDALRQRELWLQRNYP